MRTDTSGPGPVDLSAQPRSIRRRIRRHLRQLRDVSMTQVRERIRERMELDEDRARLARARSGRDVCWPSDTGRDPLVTIRISTYNRGRLVVDRAITSALAQTHRNIEVLVIGDACDAETASAVHGVKDPRVTFVNLPRRPQYPEAHHQRWLVLGYAPGNVGIELARGDWIAPCDDDDELTPDHVEQLLDTALRERAEFVHSRTAVAVGNGQWALLGRPVMALGHTTHGSVLYSAGLRFMRYSSTCWRLNEPLDWNLFRRMDAIGVRVAYCNAVTYRYYPSGATADEFRRRYEQAIGRSRGRLGRVRSLFEA